MSEINWSVQHKHDSAANWTNENPILLEGQFGLESNVGKYNRVKVGNGTSHWNDLNYLAANGSYTQESTTGLIFVGNSINGTVASPLVGDIAADYGLAVLGVRAIVIHNDVVEPNYPVSFKKSSLSGNYITGRVNFIVCDYYDPLTVVYSIFQIN